MGPRDPIAAMRSDARRFGWDGVHWTDWCLVAVLCAVPLVAAYKIWQNAEVLLKTAAAIVLLGAVFRGRFREEVKRFIGNFRTPLGMLALMAIAYAIASSLWASPVLGPDMKYLYPTVGALRSFWLVIAAAIVANRLGEIHSERVHLLLAVATAVGLVLLFVEIAAKFPVTRKIASSVRNGQINPNVLTLSMLVWPAIATLLVQRLRIAAVALWLLAGAVVGMGSSGAATLGYALGSILVAIAWFSAPLAIWTATTSAIAGLLVAPFVSSAAGVLMQFLPTDFAKSSHPLRRIEIWQQHGASIEQAPLFGIGFRGLGGEHPHNAALQIWLDFGAMGVILAIGLVALTGAALLRSKNSGKPFALACAGGIYASAYVSYGLWEAQWLAIELLVVIFAIHALRESPRGTSNV
jgi:exopolysaccharide production protein ExoQ